MTPPIGTLLALAGSLIAYEPARDVQPARSLVIRVQASTSEVMRTEEERAKKTYQRMQLIFGLTVKEFQAQRVNIVGLDSNYIDFSSMMSGEPDKNDQKVLKAIFSRLASLDLNDDEVVQVIRHLVSRLKAIENGKIINSTKVAPALSEIEQEIQRLTGGQDTNDILARNVKIDAVGATFIERLKKMMTLVSQSGNDPDIDAIASFLTQNTQSEILEVIFDIENPRKSTQGNWVDYDNIVNVKVKTAQGNIEEKRLMSVTLSTTDVVASAQMDPKHFKIILKAEKKAVKFE